MRRYWPGLPDGALVADYSGVRPKLAGPGGVVKVESVVGTRFLTVRKGPCRWGGKGGVGLVFLLCFFGAVFSVFGVPNKNRDVVKTKIMEWHKSQSLGHPMAGRKFHTQHHRMIWSFW